MSIQERLRKPQPLGARRLHARRQNPLQTLPAQLQPLGPARLPGGAEGGPPPRTFLPWTLVHAGHLGVPEQAALLHRIAIAVEGKPTPANALRPEEVKIAGDRFVSDTGQLIWDLSRKERGVVTVNTPMSEAVIGFAGGRPFELGGVGIEPKQTIQDGWCVITLTAIEGAMPQQAKGAFTGSFRLIVTATGFAENTEMGWKELQGDKVSVGKDWGKAPSLVEGITAKIVFSAPAKGVRAWALDERGQRKAAIPVDRGPNGNAVLSLDPRWQTLWYEVATE